MYYIYSEGMSRDLDEGETLLFKPVCKKLDLPLQPPVTVKFFNSKKVSIIDKPTGRAIVYIVCYQCFEFSIYCFIRSITFNVWESSRYFFIQGNKVCKC